MLRIGRAADETFTLREDDAHGGEDVVGDDGSKLEALRLAEATAEDGNHLFEQGTLTRLASAEEEQFRNVARIRALLAKTPIELLRSRTRSGDGSGMGA
jgi:hypothetical protein